MRDPRRQESDAGELFASHELSAALVDLCGFSYMARSLSVISL